jgi:hypothetical protein
MFMHLTHGDRQMRRITAMAALLTLALAAAPDAAAAQLRDLTIGSRALTDADLEKYVAITRELAVAKKGIPALSSPAGLAAFRDSTAKAADRHGWGSMDSSVVDARLNAALMHLRMPNVPVPADKRADVDLARKWKAKIDDAKVATTKTPRSP